MDIGRLTDEARKLIDERGGMDALKEDAEELKDIAQGGGSLTEKAKAAVEALQDPGAKGDDTPETPPANPAG